MRHIYFFLSLLFLIAGQISYGQVHSVVGHVHSTVDQQPLPGVTVRILGVSNSWVTDETGTFSFDGLAAGSYPLVFSYLVYESSRLSITLPSPKSATLSVALTPTENQLQAVEILGRKEQSYKNTASFAGTKTETPIRFVPQAISYVTKEVIDDQQAFKTSDVIKNISGVNVFSFYNNDFTLRGYRASNALING